MAGKISVAQLGDAGVGVRVAGTLIVEVVRARPSVVAVHEHVRAPRGPRLPGLRHQRLAEHRVREAASFTRLAVAPQRHLRGHGVETVEVVPHFVPARVGREAVVHRRRRGTVVRHGAAAGLRRGVRRRECREKRDKQNRAGGEPRGAGHAAPLFRTARWEAGRLRPAPETGNRPDGPGVSPPEPARYALRLSCADSRPGCACAAGSRPASPR